MNSVSLDSSLQTYATCDDVEMIPSEPWGHSDSGTKDNIKALIAKLVTSQKPGQEVVRPQDVFLYPKGMCAIGTVVRLLVPTSTRSSEAVIFG
jgi:cystathionine gamma-synthase